MAKLTAIIVTIIGILLILQALGVEVITQYNGWLIAIGVLIIGIGKLLRNFKSK